MCIWQVRSVVPNQRDSQTHSIIFFVSPFPTPRDTWLEDGHSNENEEERADMTVYRVILPEPARYIRRGFTWRLVADSLLSRETIPQ